MIRITVNLCKNHLSSYLNKNKVSLEEIENRGMQEEEMQVLEEVLALPSKLKAPIYLHYYEGYKCSEIAEMLRVRESTIKMRLKRGRELLRLELSGKENEV